MAVVYKDSFIDQAEDDQYTCEVNAWMREILTSQVCLVCGEIVYGKRNFIWWRGDNDVILCEDCAEHTISGLSRDLVELKGDKEAVGKTGSFYDPVLLKGEVDRLQGKISEYLKRIVTLQSILAKPD